MLELRQVSKVYGTARPRCTRCATSTLSVEAGELVAVMGPSGSGKSTLLTIAGSLEEATSGEVLVAGAAVAGLSATSGPGCGARSIGYVFQDFNLLAGLTAVENVAMPLELDGGRRRAARIGRRSTSWRARPGRAGRPLPRRPSGGERQRVAIARAVVGERRTRSWPTSPPARSTRSTARR